VDPQTIRVRFDCLLNLEMKDVMCMHVMLMNRVHAVIIHCSHLTCPYRSSIVFVLAPSSNRTPITIPTMVKRALKRALGQDAAEAKDTTDLAADLSDDAPHTPAKKFDKTPGAYSNSAKKAQAIGAWNRLARGDVKKATLDDIENAKNALKLMKELPDERKVEFAESYFASPGTKDFAFVKEYEEKMRNEKITTNSAVENRLTRIFF
jgi:hypothetical protein